MDLPIKVYSGLTLEPWDYRTPFTTGIGGSETSHVYMVRDLAARGLAVTSYAPVKRSKVDPDTRVQWRPYTSLDLSKPAVVINYRDPQLFQAEKPPTSKWWFIAQDCDYPFPEGVLEKIDRYITLCSTHAKQTLAKYPQLMGRVFQSSNGLDPARISAALKEAGPRDPYQLIYTSSPDRGLKLLLENWFRIKEQVPEAHLEVFYGFNNMERVAQIMGGKDWRPTYQSYLESLLQQPGITFHGRVPQPTLYKHIAQSSIWPYLTDWPETSCITCMEMQALGATPITNDFWALKDNVAFGDRVAGIPQNSTLIKCLMIEQIIYRLKNPMPEKYRDHMMIWAADHFKWERVGKQWQNWLEKDCQ